MQQTDSQLHHRTPTLSVVDPRGFAVRTVAYWRTSADQAAQPRVERLRYDLAGNPVSQSDARLGERAEAGEEVQANQRTAYSLSGRVLSTDSVDAGWRITLPGEAGQALRVWDGRASTSRTEYDAQLRPVTVYERSEGDAEQCVERWTYGDASADVGDNLRGQVVRHDDPAGSKTLRYGALGAVRTESLRFLAELDVPDWPISEDARDGLLEAQTYLTTWAYDAVGGITAQTDACGNLRTHQYNVSGALAATAVRLASQSASQAVISSMSYDAFGQVEREVLGNGVVNTTTYSPVDGRLLRLATHKADGSLVQDIHYRYDPAGNITAIRDDSLSVRYQGNERIEPETRYSYDTLYQLIEATGRESLAADNGPALPGLEPPNDPSRQRNYRQTYTYDDGGNLTSVEHHAAGNSHTRRTVVSTTSNRSLLHPDGAPKPDPDRGFDANGNQLALQPGGTTLHWNARNQLSRVVSLSREAGQDDDEVYCYDGSGLRARKERRWQASHVRHVATVRYLPGLEMRTNTAKDERLQEISVPAGRTSVRILHWEQGRPDGVVQGQVRYSVSDHLGSVAVELDQQADLISHEGYYPYGGTAWWCGRNEVETRYRTIRYSGKERDATGLYYYGFRYYQCWVGRWLSADPAGPVDGINLYRMTRNNPVTYYDNGGLNSVRTHFDEKDIEGFSSIFQSIKEGLTAEGISAEETTFIMLGRSPQALGEFIGQSGYKVALLPISGLSVRHQMSDDVSAEARENRRNYVNKFLGEALSGAKHAVLLDYSTTGNSLVQAQKLLTPFFGSVTFKTAMISLFLNAKEFGEQERFADESNILYVHKEKRGRLNYHHRGVRRAMKIFHHEVDKRLTYTDKFSLERIDRGEFPEINERSRTRLQGMMSRALAQYGNDVVYIDAKNPDKKISLIAFSRNWHPKYTSMDHYISWWNFKHSTHGRLIYGALNWAYRGKNWLTGSRG